MDLAAWNSLKPGDVVEHERFGRIEVAAHEPHLMGWYPDGILRSKDGLTYHKYELMTLISRAPVEDAVLVNKARAEENAKKVEAAVAAYMALHKRRMGEIWGKPAPEVHIPRSSWPAAALDEPPRRGSDYERIAKKGWWW